MLVRCWVLQNWDDCRYREKPPVEREIDPETSLLEVSPHAHDAHPDWKCRLADGTAIAVESLAQVGVRSVRPG